MPRTAIKTLTVIFVMALCTATSAIAQVDLAGSWANRMHEDWGDRFHGPDAVDFTGLPLNDDGRARALSYSSSQLAMPERMCIQYQPQYVVLGPQAIQVWSEDEPVTGRLIAWHISGAGDRTPLTIWMDGRPHPSANAPHTFAGFSTGVWEGDVLTAYTTHMKAGPLRRNGAPGSDQTTVTYRIVRHADLLTIVAFIDDPVYLTQSHVVSRTWKLEPGMLQNRYATPCYPAVQIERLGGSGNSGEVIVPHYLPEKNPYADETSQAYHLPLEAVYGQAETLYPEYRKKMKEAYVAPTICVRYCCGWMSSPGADDDAPGLNCRHFTDVEAAAAKKK